MIASTSTLTTQTRNRFESFDEFKSFVHKAFIEGSGIDQELFDACVEFHQDQEFDDGHEVETPIHSVLGWDFKRFGYQANETLYAALLKNEDGSVWQAIVSIWDEERERPYRYLAPKGIGDRAFLPPIPPTIRKRIGSKYGVEVPMSGSFWDWVQETDLPRILTEGGKKGLCGLSHGYVAIAIYGCTCGAKNKDSQDRFVKPYLIDDLQRFALSGSRWLFAFDRDEKQKAKLAVANGKKNLRLALNAASCTTVDIMWKAVNGKGLDDFVINNGSGAFDAEYQKAIARLEKQFASVDSTEKIPPANKVARSIAEDYQGKLAYNNETGQWMRYEADGLGMWSSETDEFLESIIYQIITAKGIEDYSSHSYIINIVKSLRNQLIERKWRERSPKELLPFTNGVLEVATGELLPHSPGYYLTWQLPREYTLENNEWSTIDNFLDHLASGNEAIKELLICYCNAVLKGRHDLQKFLHLIGLGGTGKGTFARLLTSLIGPMNVLTTTLEDWCSNRFEGANAYRKRLVLFPDEDKQTGKLGKFLSLTGEDLIRAEEKSKKAFQYRFDGMVLVLSNLPIFGGDSANRVKRRVLPVPCNNPVSKSQSRNLEAEFEPELAAFTNYVLNLSDDHVTNVLMGLKEIPECTLEFWENRIRVDSIAAWLNNYVIYDPMSETPIGCDRHEGENGLTITTLFGSYNRHCRQVGDSPKSHKNFSPDLLELCHSVLGWEVERKVTKTGKFIRGLRLRVSGIDDHISTHDYTLIQRVTVGDGSGDGSGDDSEPLLDLGFEQGDGSTLTSREKETNLDLEVQVKNQEFEDSVEILPSPNPETLEDKHFVPSPETVTPTVTPTVTNVIAKPQGFAQIASPPSPQDFRVEGQPSVSSPTPQPPLPRSPRDLAVGDVVSVLDYPKLKGKRVTVSSVTQTGIWVRLPNAIAPFGPFHPHQLRRCC